MNRRLQVSGMVVSVLLGLGLAKITVLLFSENSDKRKKLEPTVS